MANARSGTALAHIWVTMLAAVVASGLIVLVSSSAAFDNPRADPAPATSDPSK